MNNGDYIVESENTKSTEDLLSFDSLPIADEIRRAIKELNFEKCTSVQSMSLPITLEGFDFACKAQTGTGKTAAFLITLLNHFLQNPLENQKKKYPRALILAPTRELALQIAEDAKNLGKFCNVNILTLHGGMHYEKQKEQASGKIDIVVATPGRLLDFNRNGYINLREVEFLVLDEADRMLDMGFIPDVRRIISALPSVKNRTTHLFSATLEDKILQLASQWLKKEYKTVIVDSDTVVTENIQQIIYTINTPNKLAFILWHLKNDNVDRMIIFSNRRIEASKLNDQIYRYGYEPSLLTGEVPQKKRLRILDEFKEGKIKLIVATDVAGRGIHVDNVTHVINYDLPYEVEDYVHRIGRTGRAGSKGKALSFACEDSAFELPAIEEYIGESLQCYEPLDDMLILPEVVREAPKKAFVERKNETSRRNPRGNYKGKGNGGNRSFRKKY